MWILSQNKEIVLQSPHIVNFAVRKINNDDKSVFKHGVFAFCVNNSTCLLGEYNTKKMAKDIEFELYNLLRENVTSYEMPA